MSDFKAEMLKNFIMSNLAQEPYLALARPSTTWGRFCGKVGLRKTMRVLLEKYFLKKVI